MSLVTDGSGGVVRPSAGSGAAMPTDIGYTGQRLDATGLMFYGARYYDSGLSRFISADTVVPGAGNPQALNRYSYVMGNPLKYTDPTGHACLANFQSDGCGGSDAAGRGSGDGIARGGMPAPNEPLTVNESQALSKMPRTDLDPQRAQVRLQSGEGYGRYESISPDIRAAERPAHPLTRGDVEDIGIEHGRSMAEADGLTPTGWQNPRRQGFDDIMTGPSGDPFIVEYKGGTSQLRTGQMKDESIRKNIRELYKQGDPMADVLQEAYDTGKLSGVVYSTPIEDSIPQVTRSEWFWYGVEP